MNRYKRREDGSHFDTQQARDERGRFTAPPKKKRAAELSKASERRPGESWEEHLRRLGEEASERMAKWMRDYEGKL